MTRDGKPRPPAVARDIVAAGVVGLAAAVRAGGLRATDALECYLDRIARHGPGLNAFVALDAAAARDAASALDRRGGSEQLGALAGVPVAVKDNLDVCGFPTAAGIGALRGSLPREDATCVARLRASGALLLGKTNMDEAALGATGDNPHFGRCHNPHRLDCTPGGSSAGSAAAVAGGLAAAALGSDTLGSIRIPASYCGCAGFKPTRGSVPSAGLVPLSISLDHVGILARSIADCAAVYDVVLGTASGAAGLSPAALTSARIGLVTGLSVALEIAQAAKQGATALGAQGASVRSCELSGIDLTRLRRAGFLVAEAEGALAHKRLLADAASGISQGLRAALVYGAAQPPERIARARELIQEAAARLDELFACVDLLVLPTTPQTAFRFDVPVPVDQAKFTSLANAGGFPALSLPAGWSGDGLPLALQIIGPRGSDVTVLAAGAACEQAFGPCPPAMLSS